MKNSFFLMGLFASVFCTLTAPACEGDCNDLAQYDCFVEQDEDKVYIDPEKVIIFNKQIFLNVENTPLLVSALYSDDAGIYLSKKHEKKEKKGKEQEIQWICPECGYTNSAGSFICGNLKNHKRYQFDLR